jgi:hypothetical protein
MIFQYGWGIPTTKAKENEERIVIFIAVLSQPNTLSKGEFVMKKTTLIWICTMISIVFTACGPSQAELDATATQSAAYLFATQTAAAPTVTPTFTPTPTPTPVPPTSTPTPPQCKIISITPVRGTTDPVSGGEVPSFDYLADGFVPNDSVTINITGTSDLGGLSITSSTMDFLQADAQGQIEGNITWDLMGMGSTPTDMVIEIEGTGCSLNQDLVWP